LDISVVIPLYNKELYIRRTIESVLSQNTPPKEILVIDDGSTDGSAVEVQKILDARVRLIHQQNSGECAARNRGVAEAKHDLVAFLDADDEWKPDFITHIQRLYLNFPGCGAYATAYEIIQPGGSIFHYPIGEVPPSPWIGIIPNFFRMIQISVPFFPSSIAIPKKVFREIGGFPEGVKRGGDIVMWIKLAVQYSIAYSPSHQVTYHTEADNRACVIFPSDDMPAYIKIMREMLKNQAVPMDFLGDFKDYYAHLIIHKAKELVKSGNSRSARALLADVRDNRRHRLEWIRWYLISFVPFQLIPFLNNIRSRFFPKIKLVSGKGK
jgi:glycosyltransferase involved in cell wall biosynthesis